MSGPVESILALGGGLEERLSERREERERHTAQQPDAGSTREDTGPAPKRLIVCCDGTAKDGVNTEKPITNVARIARCIKNDDRGNNSGHPGPQIVFYLRGIGTGTSYLANLVDRVLGRGISSTIRESYAFLCLNWNPHDEIVLIGFSRGAFTVRVVAEMINDIGLLKKDDMHLLNEIYDLWQSGRAADRRKGHDSRSSIAAIQRTYGDMLRARVAVKACAVWDTVPALSFSGENLTFVDESIPPCVALALHALALNEERSQFQPLLWKDPGGPGGRILRQCWFLGSHSDVGGGNEEQALANISLMWMISQLSHILEFDTDAIRNLTRGPILKEVARQRQSQKTNVRVTNVHRESGSFILSLHLPVEIFQARTGVQVRWFATFQRIFGWSDRLLFSLDPDDEKIHWTVAILLKHQIVSACRPLDLETQKAKDRGDDDPQKSRTEECSELERQMLASWIAFDCSQFLRINKEAERPSSGRGSAQQRPSLVLSHQVLPIYLVLWDHDKWQTINKLDHKNIISIKVDGKIHVHKQIIGPAGNVIESSEVVESVTLGHMTVKKVAWRFKGGKERRYNGGRNPTLIGSISVPSTKNRISLDFARDFDETAVLTKSFRPE